MIKKHNALRNQNRRAVWLDPAQSRTVENMSRISGVPMGVIVNRVLAARLPALERAYLLLFADSAVTPVVQPEQGDAKAET